MKLSSVGLSISFIILTTSVALASTIEVNGTCEQGWCGNPDVVSIGSSISAPFDFIYRFSNSDTFRLQGESGGFYNPSLIALTLDNFLVTYLGNDLGSVSGDDVLDNEFTQSYGYSAGGTSADTVNLYGTFGPGLGLASNASAIGYDRGNLISSLGPVAPPPNDFLVSKTVSVFRAAGNPVLDYHFILSFGAGSAPGSTIELYPDTPTPVPKPSTIILVGAGISSALAFRRTVAQKCSSLRDAS